MPGLVEWDLLLKGWRGSDNKIRPSSAFDSQFSIIPLLQRRIFDIPLFHWDSEVFAQNQLGGYGLPSRRARPAKRRLQAPAKTRRATEVVRRVQKSSFT